MRNTKNKSDEEKTEVALRRGARTQSNTLHDPVERRVRNRERAEAAPDGFVTRGVLREKVGLTEAQLRLLTAKGIVSSDGTNSSGYALYETATVDRLLMMKGDGSLSRAVSSAAAAAGRASRATWPMPLFATPPNTACACLSCCARAKHSSRSSSQPAFIPSW